MSDHPTLPAAPPEVQDVAEEAQPLAEFESTVPAPVDPEMLVRGLRYLQARIPELEQLSVPEERSLLRAAHLPAEFVEIGIQTAEAWNEPKVLVGWTGEELRREAAQVQQWDAVERELRVLLEGIASANLRRRHRIGSTVLRIYHLLRAGGRPHLRPYLDEMKRAYMRKRSQPRKRKVAPEPDTPPSD